MGPDVNRRDAARNGLDPVAVSVVNVGRIDPATCDAGYAALEAV